MLQWKKASDRRARRFRGMSAVPPIAIELVTRGSPSLCAITGREQAQQIRALLIASPQHPSLSRTRRDRLHRPFHDVVTNAKPHIRADAGREPVMETGPDARAGYLLG